MIKNEALDKEHLIEVDFPLSLLVQDLLEKEDWKALDFYFSNLSKKEGSLYLFLQQYLDFESIEHIIAIREAPGDEEGIWHDDGSRLLGFSLSLNLKPKEIKGGELYFRPKGFPESKVFTPRPWGKILLFKTGIYGFEHKVGAVTEGRRVVIAGWCS